MSRRFTGDYVGILLTFIVFTIAVAMSFYLQIDPLTKARGSTLNDGRFGTLTLYNWLNDLGYNVHTQPDDTLLPTAQDKILFILSPNKEFSQTERLLIDQWVTNGGTLVWAQEKAAPQTLLRHFELRTRRQWPTTRSTILTLPTLNWPLVGTIDLRASRRIEIDCGQAAIHIGDCDHPLLVSFGWGNGQVYFVSSLFPFTNGGLTNSGNAQLVRNLVQLNASPGTRILFDEVHHQGASFWLVQTFGGWATILLFVLLIIYGLQSNQRFGSPRPALARHEPERRETAAFINHLAAAQKEFDLSLRIRDHYWRRLKRKLAQRYSIDPQFPDDLFLAELRPYLDEYQMGRLIYLLAQLDRQKMNELDFQQWTVELINFQENMDVQR